MNKNIFEQIEIKRPERSTFDLTHDHKTTFDMGELVPVLCAEVMPGDTFNVQTEQFIKFQPLIAPVMHGIDVYTHSFFVPHRLVCPGWEEMITGGDVPGAPANLAMPYITIGHNEPFLPVPEIGSAADYLGYPTYVNIATGRNIKVSPMQIASFALIIDEYYRDENLQEKYDIQLVPGNNNGNFALLPFLQANNVPRRAWEHDYFTSALPFAQKGDPVTLPLGDTAPILYVPGQLGSILEDELGAPLSPGDPDYIFPGGETMLSSSGDTPARPANVNNAASLVADLSNATAATINSLRRAFKLQEWLELNARGGTRYTEQIRAHFAVISDDARLQRPEYLGGSKQPVSVGEISSTSQVQYTDDEDGTMIPQGTESGKAQSYGGSHSYSYTAKEHGFIITVMSVLPRTAYYQGVPRQFTRFDKLDYAWPKFAHIGEQAILNKELVATGDTTTDDEVFGYVPRYSELRYLPSRVSGDFKDTLDYWHLARKFNPDGVVSLNADFIAANPSKRIFAVGDLPPNPDGTSPLKTWDCLIGHVLIKIRSTRPLPEFGTPML